MTAILDALDKVAARPWSRFWQAPAWKRFISTGDPKHLNSLPKPAKYESFPDELLLALGLPATLEEHARRLLQACLAAGLDCAAGEWLEGLSREGVPPGGQFQAGCQILRDLGCSISVLANQIAEHARPFLLPDGAPAPSGLFLTRLSDPDLRRLVVSLDKDGAELLDLGRLFAATDAARFSSLLDQILKDNAGANLGADFWMGLLEQNPKQFTALSERALDGLKDPYEQFQLAKQLRQAGLARYGSRTDELARLILSRQNTPSTLGFADEADAAAWLASSLGEGAMVDLRKYFAAAASRRPELRKQQSESKNRVLDLAVKQLGRQAVPLLEACFEASQPEVHFQALALWTSFKNESDTAPITVRLREALGGAELPVVARCVRLAGDWNPAAVEAQLWPLLAHKHRPVRDAASAALARLGDSRLSKAPLLLAARRAGVRLAAVSWLKALGTPAATAELSARLDTEEDDTVRDSLLQALETLLGEAATASLDQTRARIAKTLAKLDGPPVPWLDPKKLPAAALKDGSPLRSDWVSYLLYRQSRVKDMRADLEAKPVYAQVDRATSGDLALAAAQAFLGSSQDAGDRWVLAFAAILGDDRLVPLLARHIKDWAANMRGKLAEYAVQALALLGTDCALLAVDAMTIRYRSQNKNIGKAASEAFAAAAAARGLTTEELGDLVVPWLGFEPGRPRVVAAGKAQLEVRINNEFKLAFRDLATNKTAAKLPASASAEVKTEFKELSASLKEAVKSQLLRMENLMVRQFRWPVNRWNELFLRHPLLIPFAQRLVWGHYDEAGRLQTTFRALDDLSLTSADDEPCALPIQGGAGIVHPLELTPAARQAWLKHLADYNVTPPFGQMERPVTTVKAEQRRLKYGMHIAGTNINAMTFKGRAERLGWARGSVCDAGLVNYYLKRFPAADADVFVETEGMCVGIDMYTDIKLGQVFFVKHGSVKIGGYEYDEPAGDNDERLLAFGDVPPIAFSEAMGDLARIAGKSQATTVAPPED